MKKFARMMLLALVLAGAGCEEEDDLYGSDAGDDNDVDALCSVYARCASDICGFDEDEILAECYDAADKGTLDGALIKEATEQKCAEMRNSSNEWCNPQ